MRRFLYQIFISNEREKNAHYNNVFFEFIGEVIQTCKHSVLDVRKREEKIVTV